MNLVNLILSNDRNTAVRILILSGVAWIPLVVLTFIDGTLFATDITMPFIKDVTPYIQGLIVISLLVMTDNVIEPMMARTLKYFQTSSVVPKLEKERLNDVAIKMAYLMNVKWMQLILAMLAIAFSWLLQSDYVALWTERGVTSWVLHEENGEVNKTIAGTWFLLISSPLVSFLLYRWVWRFVVWSIFLYRFSRMKLVLYASHSDLAGGLGVIGEGQSLFGIVFLIMAIVISSDLARKVLYEGEKLLDVKQVVIVFIFISIAALLIPLLFFTRKLFNLKHKALAEYGALQHNASRDFHMRWIKNESSDLVDSMQPSAMADYSAVYETISNMRIVPLNPKTLVVLVVVLIIPFLLLALTESSIWDVLKIIGGSLL